MVANKPSERFQEELCKSVVGTPWNPLAIPGKTTVPKGLRGTQARNIYITSKLIEKHGKTKGCPKCQNGTGVHTESCVKRFRELEHGAKTQEEDTVPGFSTTTSSGSSSSSAIGPAPGLQTEEQEGDTEGGERASEERSERPFGFIDHTSMQDIDIMDAKPGSSKRRLKVSFVSQIIERPLEKRALRVTSSSDTMHQPAPKRARRARVDRGCVS